MTLPVATLEHQLPGRVRLRVPSKRGDCAYFDTARQRLGDAPAVGEISANAKTGSLIIRDCSDLEKLKSEAAKRGLFSLADDKPAARTAKPGRSRAGAASTVDPYAATTAGLSGLGLYQLTQGRVLASASEHFWHAYGAYRILKSPSLALALCGLGVWQLVRGNWLGSASTLLFYALILHQMATEEETGRDDTPAEPVP